MNTPEGRKKGVETMKKKHGQNVYAKIGALGGKTTQQQANPYRPMEDRAWAKLMTDKRWAKVRFEKGLISQEEYESFLIYFEQENQKRKNVSKVNV